MKKFKPIINLDVYLQEDEYLELCESGELNSYLHNKIMVDLYECPEILEFEEVE